MLSFTIKPGDKLIKGYYDVLGGPNSTSTMKAPFASLSRTQSMWKRPGRIRVSIVQSKMAEVDAVTSGLGVHSGKENNRLRAEDYCVHDWYRFILSYPPHLVRDYLRRFGVRSGNVVLDPFCGTGTTLVECKKLGIASVGIEANPMPCFASRVKIDWNVRAGDLLEWSSRGW